MLHTTAECPWGPALSVLPVGIWSLQSLAPRSIEPASASLRLSSALDDQLDIPWTEVTSSDMGPPHSFWMDGRSAASKVCVPTLPKSNPSPQQAAGIFG